MPRTEHASSVEDVAEISYEDGMAMLDRAAREVLNMTGAEFLQRWDAGDFEHTDDPAATRVAMLIPFARP